MKSRTKLRARQLPPQRLVVLKSFIKNAWHLTGLNSFEAFETSGFERMRRRIDRLRGATRSLLAASEETLLRSVNIAVDSLYNTIIPPENTHRSLEASRTQSSEQTYCPPHRRTTHIQNRELCSLASPELGFHQEQHCRESSAKTQSISDCAGILWQSFDGAEDANEAPHVDE